MFADPITATFTSSGQTSFPRIQIKDQSSVYRTPDGSCAIRISHQNTKTRTRRLVRFEDYDSNFDVNLTSDTAKAGAVVYLVIDEPNTTLYSDQGDVVKQLALDFISWLSANTNANLVKVLGSEI